MTFNCDINARGHDKDERFYVCFNVIILARFKYRFEMSFRKSICDIFIEFVQMFDYTPLTLSDFVAL